MAPVLFAGMIVDASCLAPCGSEVFTPASPTQREAKRETVEALENMSREKEEGHGRLHHCVGVRQKKAEWKSFSLFITQCISITLFYFSSFIPPPLSLSPLSSHTAAHSPHTRANRNFHSRTATQPGYPDKWEHAAHMHTLKEAL